VQELVALGCGVRKGGGRARTLHPAERCAQDQLPFPSSPSTIRNRCSAKGAGSRGGKLLAGCGCCNRVHQQRDAPHRPSRAALRQRCSMLFSIKMQLKRINFAPKTLSSKNLQASATVPEDLGPPVATMLAATSAALTCFLAATCGGGKREGCQAREW